jgi:hypothetical protein
MNDPAKAVHGNRYRFLVPPNPLKGELEYFAQIILHFSKAVLKNDFP